MGALDITALTNKLLAITLRIGASKIRVERALPGLEILFFNIILTIYEFQFGSATPVLQLLTQVVC